MTTAVILYCIQGAIGAIFTVGAAIIIAKVNALHAVTKQVEHLVNSKSDEAQTEIKLLAAQLAAQGLLLTAAEAASKHS